MSVYRKFRAKYKNIHEIHSQPKSLIQILYRDEKYMIVGKRKEYPEQIQSIWWSFMRFNYLSKKSADQIKCILYFNTSIFCKFVFIIQKYQLHATKFALVQYVSYHSNKDF